MIKIVKGDVTKPIGDGNKLIVHCCNDIISFGSGVAGAIARAWPHVREAYMSWGYTSKPGQKRPFALGQVQFVKAEDGISVCNLIGQRDIGGFTIDGVSVPPVRYEALREGFLRVREAIKAAKEPVHLHLPMLGSALAGGDWVIIYSIIYKIFGESFDITIYAFDDDNFALANHVHDNHKRILNGD